MTELRPYTPDDFEACLSVMRSNLPRFFAPNEVDDFAQFLRGDPQPYFVLLQEGEVVGCGGLHVSADGTRAGLTWGMVRRDLHGVGLGYRLFTARLAWLRAQHPQVREVRLDTSQHTAPYFARQGFRVTDTVPDGFGAGIDKVSMTLLLEDSK